MTGSGGGVWTAAMSRRDGVLEAAGWSEALDAVAGALEGLDGGACAALAGDLADCESMTALADLMAAVGSPHLDCRQDGARLDPGCRASYLFNTTIAGIEEADAILIVGANPRREAALVNARIRKRWRRGGLAVGMVGARADLTYPVTHIGGGPSSLSALRSGEHSFRAVLEAAERPMIVVGMGAISRPDGAAVLAEARALAEEAGMVVDGWNGFNVLHTAAARVGGFELGFTPGEGGLSTAEICEAAGGGGIRFLYLLGADELPLTRPESCFIVYQGHHGDAGAQIADVVLPGTAYTEKPATYVQSRRAAATRLAGDGAARRRAGGLAYSASARGPHRRDARLRHVGRVAGADGRTRASTCADR